MRSRLLALVIATAACGGTSKPTTPPPVLPDDNVAKTEPPKPEDKPAEEAPPPQLEPADVVFTMGKGEVKLVSAGKGKKEKDALTPKPGTKQQAEWSVDISGTQQDEGGTKEDQFLPTMVFIGDLEAKEVDAASGQTKYVMTVTGVDARDKQGSQISGAQFKPALDGFVGTTFAGTVDANGTPSDVTLHIEKPQPIMGTPVRLLQTASLPMWWPVLPSEPIAPGAKWTVTTKVKLATAVEITRVDTYQLVSKKGDTWTVKGTSKVSGEDQTLGEGKIAGISGEGTHEVTITAGSLAPTSTQTISTSFTGTFPEKDKTLVQKVSMTIANGFTPKS
jgi:hypothetical protein